MDVSVSFFPTWKADTHADMETGKWETRREQSVGDKIIEMERWSKGNDDAQKDLNRQKASTFVTAVRRGPE